METEESARAIRLTRLFHLMSVIYLLLFFGNSLMHSYVDYFQPFFYSMISFYIAMMLLIILFGKFLLMLIVTHKKFEIALYLIFLSCMMIFSNYIISHFIKENISIVRSEIRFMASTRNLSRNVEIDNSIKEKFFKYIERFKPDDIELIGYSIFNGYYLFFINDGSIGKMNAEVIYKDGESIMAIHESALDSLRREMREAESQTGSQIPGNQDS